ncbi:hypothetical protein [Alteromonas sp. H39]|uniref:hypothetical protein n=1 Tax=Alteromonas sp. H39 TaxID=3389876 RepID=UPI0039E05109
MLDTFRVSLSNLRESLDMGSRLADVLEFTLNSVAILAELKLDIKGAERTQTPTNSVMANKITVPKRVDRKFQSYENCGYQRGAYGKAGWKRVVLECSLLFMS